MNTPGDARTRREGAQIVPFPAGGRAGLAAPKAEPPSSEAVKRSPPVNFGSWYHEEAIREDSGRTN